MCLLWLCRLDSTTGVYTRSESIESIGLDTGDPGNSTHVSLRLTRYRVLAFNSIVYTITIHSQIKDVRNG